MPRQLKRSASAAALTTTGAKTATVTTTAKTTRTKSKMAAVVAIANGQKCPPLAYNASDVVEVINDDENCPLLTLRLCLRYGRDHINAFKRLIEHLESVDLPPILKKLSVEELHRFIPMLANDLTRIQLELTDMKYMRKICFEAGVTEFPQVTYCIVRGSHQKQSNCDINNAMQRLGELMPGLSKLHISASLVDAFPQNLSQLTTLVLNMNITQWVLDQVCKNCPNLLRLHVRSDTVPATPIECSNLRKCSELRHLQVPLMFRCIAFLRHLNHLQFLSLHRTQPWPDMDWLASVRKIIKCKKRELRSLRFDGTWLSSPFDFSLLELRYCSCFQSLLLSNCKLTERSRHAVLPLSCHNLLLQGCTVSSLFRFLQDAKQLKQLELFDCPLPRKTELLLQLMKQRKCQPTLWPLKIRFSHVPPLSSELRSWGPNRRKFYEEHLEVVESFANEPTWHNTPGAIAMAFGPPVNFTPQIGKLADDPNPTAAELLKQLGWT